jgi:predicted RNA-binding protein with RPS1 domain
MNTNVVEMKTTRENFKIGQEIEVVITGVKEFGAFGVTIMRGVEHTALIHRSIIHPEDKFPEVSRYFREGDTVKGKVLNFDKKGNMSMSVVDYFHLLKDYSAIEAEEENAYEFSEEIENEKIEPETYLMTEDEAEKVYNKIKPTLENSLNFITAEAEREFKEIIRMIGVVEFCLSLGKIAPTFFVDPGLILADMVKKDTRGLL